MVRTNDFLPYTWCLLLHLLAGPSALAQQPGTEAPDMTGKTVFITGSTDGLGRELALRLGSLGARVLVHGRDADRGRAVVGEINAGPGSAVFYQADFGSLADVRDLAEAVLRDNSRLDVLINNAGIGPGYAGGERRLSADGHEMIFQVNYLAHYLLTELLLPRLEQSAPARIINVASGAQRNVDFDDPMLERGFSASRAYAQSKLAQILHALHMAQQLAGLGVSFNTLHPASLMDTTMVEQMGRTPRSSIDEGADAVMQLAVSPALAGRTGLYFDGLEQGRADAQAYDERARERLDVLSRELLGLPLR